MVDIFWIVLGVCRFFCVMVGGGTGIEITDFQTPDHTSGTIKYLPDIFKIHRTSCIMATFDMHKYSFCEINTYCVNKPCIIFFYYFFLYHIHCKKFI